MAEPNDLDIYRPGPEVSTQKEKPIRKIIWQEKPDGPIDESIKARLNEFFRGPEVPQEVKAMGILSTELLVTTSRELGHTYLQTTLYTTGKYIGYPTIYGMSLYKDRIDLILSPVGDYGDFSVQVFSLPIKELDNITGNIAEKLAKDKPELIDTLLSIESSVISKSSAKISLIRYLSEAKPGSIKKIHAGLEPNIGVGYSADGRNPLFKLYISEIPDTDPILGELVEFHTSSELYRKVIQQLDKSIFEEMTTEKIEEFLTKLPNWAKRVLIGKKQSEGNKSWRIYQFLEKFGFKGNEAQKTWNKSSSLSLTFVFFSEKIREKILNTFEDPTIKDAQFDPKELDSLFKEDYQRFEGKLPKGFSITQAILDKTPLKDLNI